VKELVPFLVFMLVVIGLLVFSARARRRQAVAQVERAERIAVGSEVMTTSGLYGTVVARNDDETVLLRIAPGVEVKWALAALRDMASLPVEYRPGTERDDAP
jgi:preprotein translocase subunit YajC